MINIPLYTAYAANISMLCEYYMNNTVVEIDENILSFEY